MPKVKGLWKDYTKKKIRRWIRNSLEDNDMKQYQLAERMGYEPATFSARILNGRITYIDLVQMFDIFETPDDERLEVLKPDVRIK